MKSVEALLEQLEITNTILSKFQLGYLYDKGELVSQDNQRAFQYYVQAATLEKSDANELDQKYKVFAVYNVGIMYFYCRGTDLNLEEAFTWINKAAEHGNAYALWMLGKMYELGKGVEKNEIEAYRYYYLSSKQDLDAAYFDLGRMYFEGVGISKDYGIAEQYIKKAANQGYAMTKSFLGKIYQGGYYKKESICSTYIEYFKEASSKNDPMGQYYYGWAIHDDHRYREKLFMLSAENGYADAQLKIANDYMGDRKSWKDSEFYYYPCVELPEFYLQALLKTTATLEEQQAAFEKVLDSNREKTIYAVSKFIRAKIWLMKAVDGGSTQANELFGTLNKVYNSDGHAVNTKYNGLRNFHSIIKIEKYLPDFFQKQYNLVLSEINTIVETNRLRNELKNSTIPFENIENWLKKLINSDHFIECNEWVCCVVDEIADHIHQYLISAALKSNKWSAIKKQLLSKIANLNMIIKDLNMSPLEIMIDQGDIEGVKQLVVREDIDVNFNYPLLKAASEEQIDIVILLLLHPAIDVNASKELGGPNPLWIAAKYGFLDIVEELLLHSKISINYQCSKLNDKELKCLEEFGRKKMSAQEVALCYNHQEIVNLLQAHKEALAVKRAAIRQRNLQPTGSSSSMFNHQSKVHFMFASSEQVQRAFNQPGSTQQDIELDEFDENNTLATATGLPTNIKLHV